MISTRKNGQTVCLTCDSTKSVLANGDRKACGTGCTSCSFDSATSKVVCTACAGGYYKQNDACFACPAGCSACASATECTACLASFGLKDKLCAACGVGECQTCKVPPGKTALECETCSSEFYLNTDDCGECPKFCKECTYNNMYKCTKCNDRYAKLSDGTCSPCPANCETCTANSDKTIRCTKCSSDAFSLQSDGGQDDCGNDIAGTKNETGKIKIIDCGIGDCWAYRYQVGATVTFARGCSREICTSSYRNENCKTIAGKKECKKCCKGKKCNTWELDGSAGVASLVSSSTLWFFSILFLL